MKKIVIFASGSGSNAQRIVEFSRLNTGSYFVAAIFCNNPHAYVIERSRQLEVPCYLFDKTRFNGNDSNSVMAQLSGINPDLIVLAGFLWLVPEKIVNAFLGKIINIHPALLPKYGGKGMFGEIVHQSVLASNESESGITIHYVTEKYDDGAVIIQKKCSVSKADTAETLAQKIHELEYHWYPVVISQLLEKS